MMTTEATESIARPAAEAFAFIADVRNDPRWHTDVLRASLAEGEVVGAGSVFEIQTKPVMGISSAIQGCDRSFCICSRTFFSICVKAWNCAPGA